MKKAIYTIIILLVLICSILIYTYGDYSNETINGFVILNQKDFFDDKGWLHITGKAKNIQEDAGEQVRVQVEFFNENQDSLGKTVYYFDENFSKDDTKNFDVFKIDNIDEVNTYKLIILR